MAVILAGWLCHDLLQKKHALLRNFPIIGHFRYWLESLGPELRQYIVASNTEERPFDRDQRRWIYASSKKSNDYFGFGTDNEVELQTNYLIIKHAAFPLSEALPGEPNYDSTFQIPCAKVLGGFRKRKHAFRPASIVNTSGMSFGSLSTRAVEAINRGVRLANCLQNTGEGGLARYHLNGGDLVWQIGTGYFGCRDASGRFDKARFLDQLGKFPIKAIEIKLSQGAKPGLGGVLPARKITPEIAAIRGIPMDRDCISPAGHSAFRDADSLLDFVEDLATTTGLPVGIKSAIGETTFWTKLAHLIATTGRAVDFITVDGGEGGTGAAPLVFTDHVGFPFKMAFARVFREFALEQLTHKIVFIGSGKLGFPQQSLFAFALGCDMINIGREAMLAIGCIQAMKCQTNFCPTGVATQSAWLMHGLDPKLKAARLANYITTLRKDILNVSRACGVSHPSLITGKNLEIIDGQFRGKTVLEIFDYDPTWGVPSAEDQRQIEALMAAPSTTGKPSQAPCLKGTPPVSHQAHDTVTPSNRE